ncbi:MAG: hypothetical protein GY750_15220 [Lentisphaerae bacterium]|nr:hypothetical protein [Lentisphaerota bacterium]MCP4102748.1 hypothetical protein [Lentisphaerota bacterium]
MEDGSSITPSLHTPEIVSYPNSYYRIAFRNIPQMVSCPSTTEELREHIDEKKLQTHLFTLAIQLLNDYIYSASLYHPKRHNFSLARKLILQLESSKFKNSSLEFENIIDTFIADLSINKINPTGSFLKRLLFLKELALKQVVEKPLFSGNSSSMLKRKISLSLSSSSLNLRKADPVIKKVVVVWD